MSVDEGVDTKKEISGVSAGNKDEQEREGLGNVVNTYYSNSFNTS